MGTLRKITIEGYKSIKQMSLELRPLNVLIGANGSGKSNLASFFRMVGEIAAERLERFVGKEGGADSLLFYGAKTTPQLAFALFFDDSCWYRASLEHAARDTLMFLEELLPYHRSNVEGVSEQHIGPRRGGGINETSLRLSAVAGNRLASDVIRSLEGITVFHFDDTSPESRMRRSCYLHDNRSLAHDAGNLAAFLYRLKETEPVAYNRIVGTIRLAMPWFGDFAISPLELNKRNVQLDWRERGFDAIFGPHQLPDGALRAMALITLLLQPEESLPQVVVIDEPELGLHPFAINAITGLAGAASHHCQVILATQSVALVDQLEPEDVIVVDREDGVSTFTRLESERLRDWLEDYSLGELWQKNVIGGGPV